MHEYQSGATQWYIAQYRMLGWLETIIKLAALFVGMTALLDSATEGSFGWPEGARLIQFIVLVVLSLGLAAAIFDRIIEREIIAMVFVIVNNIGHWSMVAALANDAIDARLVTAFGVLMLTGDLVKVAYIYVHDFKVRDVQRGTLIGLTLAYAAGYFILLVLEILA